MQCCAVIDRTLRPQLLPMLLVELDVFSCTDAVTAPRAGDASFASWRAACRDQAPEGVPATEAFPVSPVCLIAIPATAQRAWDFNNRPVQ